MSHTSRTQRRFAGALSLAQALPLSLVGALTLFPGCSDNVSCVYTTGCNGAGSGGSGGLAGAPATLPGDGDVIVNTPPEVATFLPTGTDAHSSSPIVLRFTESMSEASLAGAIEIVPTGAGFPGPPLTGVNQSLVGNGRMLVLLPQTLPEGEYLVNVAADAVITDVTGQELTTAPGQMIGSFTVSSTASEDPAVLATFPEDGAANQSDLTQVVVVFDRPVQGGTVNDASFAVTVDGVPPTDDPAAAPLTTEFGGFPVVDSRVYLYQSADTDGIPVPLTTNGNVVVGLSPMGAEILDEAEGNTLPPFTFDFTTAVVATPLSVSLMSMPTDAIGISNLTAGDPEELFVQIDLDAETGDRLDLFLFGTNLDPDEPQLIALLREKTLGGISPISSGNFTLAEVDILQSDSPIQARFRDGAVSFAVRLRRGNVSSPLRVLDVDTSTAGIQDALLDTTAPTILQLLNPGGTTDTFRTDQRDLVIVGESDEELSSVEVVTDVGDNGVRPPLVGSAVGDDEKVFVAAPVVAGSIGPGTVNYTVVGYDLAGNPSAPITGTLTQMGGVGPDPLTAGEMVDVQVFDASTLEPIAGAVVFTHVDLGDDVNFPFLQGLVLDANGEGSILSASMPAVGTILTAQAAGYDNFTIHGLPANRISIPLKPIAFTSNATTSGTLITDSQLAQLTLSLLGRRVGDSRTPSGAEPTLLDNGCFTDPFFGTFSCTFGPDPILPGRIGAVSYLAGNFLLSAGTFTAQNLLQAFCLELAGPVPANEAGGVTFRLPFLLSEPDTPMDEHPVELPTVSMNAVATSGIALTMLDDDVTTTGEPRVTVEALIPGVPGSVPVGMGLAFTSGILTWTIRSAYPGAVGPMGFFGMNGTVDPDFFLRAEIRDALGNRSGQRPRISKLGDLPVPNFLFPASVPQLISPGDGGNTGGPSYNLEFDNSILDIQAEPGIYHVRLVDSLGRGWDLWRPDRNDASGNMILHVPDLTGVGTLFADGAIECTLSSYGWPSFLNTDFLWSDIDREHDLFSHSAPVTFDQP